MLNIFVKHVPAAVAMLDRDMRYLQLSDRWCADYSLQSSQILGRSHYEIVPDLPERWRQIHRRGLAGETLHAEEDRWERADGGTIWLHWEIRPWGSIEGLPKGILIFSEDITRRKQTEDMLRESEATTRALLETAAQAIVAVDSEGLIVIANRMTEDMFGYIRGELLGQAIEILIPHGLRAKHAIRREGYFSNPHNRPMGVGLDLEGLRKDGTTFPLEVSLSAIETNAGKLAVAFVNDITVRKRLEQAEQTHAKEVQALAGGLLRAQEEERRRVSRELHDTICQQLASLAFDIGGLVADSPPPEDTRSRLKTLQARVVKASAETRHIAYALHPSVLDDLGLAACLRSLCNDLSAPPTKVELAFTGNVPAAALPREVASCVYRVAQESLQNIVKHASAKNVSVVLALQDGVVGLTVADDGAGFDPEAIRGKGGLGLIGMQERARLANGKLSIASQPGRGTRIVLEVPLDAASA
ncbi:MAG: PAS domain S-box protein [Acidobacteriia bacterium]|nr:PAS domain S-box protein [Terriglobia bacterium]